MATVGDKLALAQKHLYKAQLAWDPPDWLELSLFGFYALEAAVDAAAIYYGIETKKNHPSRIDAARTLRDDFGMPDVELLLRDLNETRKSEAYGEVAAPDLDAEEVVSEIETFVEAVAQLVEG